ncbi:pimeloyl-ACP methyl ester carboxylesterase [Desulfosalsimonas propionicica]|uniref:Pimeloyl-ACP methyl ester carboxylesterase n=1 Tax=Desulfosalsimonas propionicica TaxID=332175 RepID=A0A7W0HJM6_9BACT|nr:alpha/beta hydrolase [Desulfosalsimonas propionicica]MBA2880221.1 pimeloyl-ACP methyl ester carboxylesterase [Desulfosalsimonas propionicica]
MGFVEYAHPPDAPQPRPYSFKNLGSEWRLTVSVARLIASRKSLLSEAPGSATVYLIPGWKAPEATMAPLRRYLARLGYDARHWGFGTNKGDPERDCALFSDKVISHTPPGEKAALIGWSLGGVIARETARAVPEVVSVVITYGTPVIGGPAYTPAARAWGAAECRRLSAEIAKLDAENPIQVPIAAIFSRKDGMVSWPACIDRTSPKARHFEVRAPHLAMGFDPDVWRIAADQLNRFASS